MTGSFHQGHSCDHDEHGEESLLEDRKVFKSYVMLLEVGFPIV